MGWLSDMKAWYCARGSRQEPLYETRDVWAEEGSGLNADSAEWSFGNGATGYMGLPIDEGWEVISMAFHADQFPSTARVRVALVDYRTPSNAAANVIRAIELNGATDGGGVINNAFKFENLATPVPVPANGVLGFRTLAVTGAVSDARVYARLRRQIGVYQG